MERQLEAQRAVVKALSGVIDAGHELSSRRRELAFIEGRQYAAQLAIRLGLLLVGGLVLLGGVVTVDIALVTQAAAGATGGARLLYFAALHGAVGALLLGLGLRRPTKERVA